MAIFEPKPWFNPLEKINVNFSTFSTSSFYTLETRFFFSRISKNTFSRPKLPRKKKMEKWLFLDKNHGLTPLEKCQCFDFFNFLFLKLRKAFFGSRIS